MYSGFLYFLQFKSEFGNKEFMILAIVCSWSCFCLAPLRKEQPASAESKQPASCCAQHINHLVSFHSHGSLYVALENLSEAGSSQTKRFFMFCVSELTGPMEVNGCHQMVNTKIRSIIFFAAKDGDALYSQQKQDQELTVAQIMSSLLPSSDLN